jgi:hypothetical protein
LFKNGCPQDLQTSNMIWAKKCYEFMKKQTENK